MFVRLQNLQNLKHLSPYVLKCFLSYFTSYSCGTLIKQDSIGYLIFLLFETAYFFFILKWFLTQTLSVENSTYVYAFNYSFLMPLGWFQKIYCKIKCTILNFHLAYVDISHFPSKTISTAIHFTIFFSIF